MNRETCSCRAKGRLLIHVESDNVKQVRVMLTEGNNYRDFYTVYLDKGKGDFRVDGISYGKLKVETNIDSTNTIYYPDNVILFEDDNYVHELKIIDRRKKG